MPIPDATRINETIVGYLEAAGLLPRGDKFTAQNFDALMEGIEGATKSMPPQYGAPLRGAAYTGKNIGPLMRKMKGLPETISEGARFAMAKYPRLSRSLRGTWKEIAEMFPSRIATPFDPSQLILNALTETEGKSGNYHDLANLADLADQNYGNFTKAVDQEMIPGVGRISDALSTNRQAVDRTAQNTLAGLIDPATDQNTINQVVAKLMQEDTLAKGANVMRTIDYGKVRNQLNTFVRELPKKEQFEIKELQEFHSQLNNLFKTAKKELYTQEEFAEEMQGLLSYYGFTDPQRLIKGFLE